MKRLIKNFDLQSVIYAILGFILGTTIYFIAEKSDFTDKNKSYILLVIIIFFISNLLLIKAQKTEENNTKINHLIPSLTFSIGISLIYYLLSRNNIETYITNRVSSTEGYLFYFILLMTIIYIISILYFKSFLEAKEKKLSAIFSYNELVKILAKYNFAIASSMIFLFAIWFILFLWAMLFKLIDINFFYDILFDSDFTSITLSTTLIFVAFDIANRKEFAYKRILKAFSSLQIFLELISSFLILFMIFLPIMGAQKIFNTGYSSIIMLSLNGIGLILIQFIDIEKLEISNLRKWLITTYIFLQPIFALLAFYSIILRVNQYGFTPSRFMVFIAVLIFNIFNLVYLFIVIKHKLKWRETLNKLTPYIVLISTFIFLLTITPVLNPFEVSVKSQLSKYENNIEKLDLVSLKFRLSKPGEFAFENLKTKYSKDKKAMKLINKVDNCKYYWGCIDKSEASTAVTYKKPKIKLNIYPKNEKAPENIKETLLELYDSAHLGFTTIIIKDFIEDYEDKEIIVLNRVWVMGKQYLYQGFLIKQDNKYQILTENLIRNKHIKDLDFENLNITKENNYKLNFKEAK